MQRIMKTRDTAYLPPLATVDMQQDRLIDVWNNADITIKNLQHTRRADDVLGHSDSPFSVGIVLMPRAWMMSTGFRSKLNSI
mmetsp:Transcript_32036/g.70412  ORF Transcript_32036/g.70412 Transcript_32036/m.70412 type:complete len:82 (-) Transcript_32036:100-345(-)